MSNNLVRELSKAHQYIQKNDTENALLVYNAILASLPEQPDSLYGCYLALKNHNVKKSNEYLKRAVWALKCIPQNPQLISLLSKWEEELNVLNNIVPENIDLMFEKGYIDKLYSVLVKKEFLSVDEEKMLLWSMVQLGLDKDTENYIKTNNLEDKEDLDFLFIVATHYFIIKDLKKCKEICNIIKAIDKLYGGAYLLINIIKSMNNIESKIDLNNYIFNKYTEPWISYRDGFLYKNDKTACERLYISYEKYPYCLSIAVLLSYRLASILDVNIIHRYLSFFDEVAEKSSNYKILQANLQISKKYLYWNSALKSSIKLVEIQKNRFIYDNDKEVLSKVLFQMGFVLQMLNYRQQAMQVYQEVLKYDPTNNNVYINAGAMFLDAKIYPNAVGALEKALKNDETNAKAWANMFTALKNMGMEKKAEETLSKAIKLCPSDHDIKECYAMHLFNKGAYLDSFKIYKQLVKKSTDPRVIFSAAQSAASATKLPQAIKWKNNAELKIDIPKDTKIDTKVNNYFSKDFQTVALIPVGRSGSLFLHSLIDGHDSISTLPGVYFKGYFGDGVYSKILDFTNNWQKNMVENFCKIYSVLFDANSSISVPGDPMGGSTGVGKQCGLDRMGEDRNIILTIDENKFRKYLLDRLSNYSSPPSAKQFFELIHESYDNTLDRKSKKSALFYHIHNPNVDEYSRFRLTYPNSKTLLIVRNPLQALESWMKTSMPGSTHFKQFYKDKDRLQKEISYVYKEIIDKIFSILYILNHIALTHNSIAAIRLEDLKSNPTETLKSLSDWMGVEFKASLLESTFQDLEYWGPKSSLSPDLKGFDASNIKRKLGVVFGSDDIEFFRILFSPFAIRCKYDGFEVVSKKSIEEAKNYLKKPFKFENDLAVHLDGGIDELKNITRFDVLRSVLNIELDRILKYDDFIVKFELVPNTFQGNIDE